MEDHQKECNLDRVLSPTHPNSIPCGAFVNSGAAYSGSACSTGGVRSSGGAANCGACSDGVGTCRVLLGVLCVPSSVLPELGCDVSWWSDYLRADDVRR